MISIYDYLIGPSDARLFSEIAIPGSPHTSSGRGWFFFYISSNILHFLYSNFVTQIDVKYIIILISISLVIIELEYLSMYLRVSVCPVTYPFVSFGHFYFGSLLFSC